MKIFDYDNPKRLKMKLKELLTETDPTNRAIFAYIIVIFFIIVFFSYIYMHI